MCSASNMLKEQKFKCLKTPSIKNLSTVGKQRRFYHGLLIPMFNGTP